MGKVSKYPDTRTAVNPRPWSSTEEREYRMLPGVASNFDRDDELDAPHPLLTFLNTSLFFQRTPPRRRPHYPCTLRWTAAAAFF